MTEPRRSPDPALLNRAGDCYQRAKLPHEAARCYREAGSYRRAADLYERAGWFRHAADDYVNAGQPHVAAWLLVERVGDPAAARGALDHPPLLGRTDDAPVPELLRDLVLARCDLAEGRSARSVLKVLERCQTELATPNVLPDPDVETWAVAVAAAAERDDQIALLFAAAVRGGRWGAVQRWRRWMRERLHSELILPADMTGQVSHATP